jgi:hypothetical protein
MFQVNTFFFLLFYFLIVQGYHDIVSVVLLVVGETRMCCSLMDKLSNVFLKDYMGVNFDPVVACLGFLFPLVSKVEPTVGAKLTESGVAPHVALSWCITWFSHDVHDSVVWFCIWI